MAGSKLPSKLPGALSKAPQPLSSKFPASARDAKDTGPHMLMNGDLYYRQIDELIIHVCIANRFSNAEWLEFLETSFRLSRKIGRAARVGLAAFTHTYPDAKQRLQTQEFLKTHGVKPIERLGLVSDSALMRGATIAFSWLVPGASAQTFDYGGGDACLKWLREVAIFDEQRAASAWKEAREGLRLP
jgi:hypothetical protein